MNDLETEKLISLLSNDVDGLWPGRWNRAELAEWGTSLRRFAWSAVEAEIRRAYRGEGTHRAGYKPSLGAVIACLRGSVEPSRRGPAIVDFPAMLRRKHPELQATSNLETLLRHHAQLVRQNVWAPRIDGNVDEAERKLPTLIAACARDLRNYCGLPPDQATETAELIDLPRDDFREAVVGMRNRGPYPRVAS